MTQPKGFFKEGGKTKPRHQKKGITEDKLNVSVTGNNDTILVNAKDGNRQKSSGMKLTKMQNDMFAKLQNMDSVLTEGDVNYFKNTINGTYSSDHGRKDVPLNKFQSEILDMITTDKGGYKLTESQSEKGLKFLKQKRIFHDTLSQHERSLIENIKEFRLVGMHDKGNGSYRFYVPVYRVISKDGDSFDYNIAATPTGQVGVEVVA